jgi:hypothetical protein
MAYEHPKHPYRPVLFAGDYPPPTETYDEIAKTQDEQWRAEMVENHPSQQFEFARYEREELLRRRMSGTNAEPYRTDGALSPREQQRERDYEIAARTLQYGLPDSEGEPVAVKGGIPVRFSR